AENEELQCGRQQQGLEGGCPQAIHEHLPERLLLRRRIAAMAVAAVLAVVTACAPSPKPPSKPLDAQLRKIYSTEWQWRQDQLADDEDSQRPVADHLPRVDPAAQQARLRYWQDVLRQLQGIDRDQLSS